MVTTEPAIEHFCAKWDAHGTSWRREAHRKRGGATYRIVRYADLCRAWYWAVDALQAGGASVHLAHPLGVKAFEYRRSRRCSRSRGHGGLVADGSSACIGAIPSSIFVT
jgi:hypothetical protein